MAGVFGTLPFGINIYPTWSTIHHLFPLRPCI